MKEEWSEVFTGKDCVKGDFCIVGVRVVEEVQEEGF